MIGMLVVGGLHVRTETSRNILSHPAGLTDAEFSTANTALQTYYKRVSVYVILDFLTILILGPVADHQLLLSVNRTISL